MTETKEVWVDISKVDDSFMAYKISNQGRICNRKGKICKCKGNRVNLLNRNGNTVSRAVSLLVAKAFDLEAPQCTRACYVHHKDGDVNNNCIDNLYWDEWRSVVEERKAAKRNRVVLDDEWYKRLDIVEKRYGSVIKAPNDDSDWQWVTRKARGID